MGVCGQVVAIDNKESTRVFFSMDPALSLHPYTLIPHKTDWGGTIFVIQKNTSRILLLFPSPPAFLFLLISMICGWCTLFRMNSKTSRVWLTTTLEAVEYRRCYDFTAKMMVVGDLVTWRCVQVVSVCPPSRFFRCAQPAWAAAVKEAAAAGTAIYSQHIRS